MWGASVQSQRAEDRFYHNKLGFSFAKPADWKVNAGSKSIVAQAPDGSASLTLTIRRRDKAASTCWEYSAMPVRLGGKGGLIRVFIDKPEGIDLDDCEKVSLAVSAILDVEDPLPGPLRNEVDKAEEVLVGVAEAHASADAGLEVRRTAGHVEGDHALVGVPDIHHPVEFFIIIDN